MVGRPSKEATEARAEAQTEGEAVPKSQRRRRASTGGFQQKLDAPQRAGYVRRWVDNTPTRLHAMEELGYAMVNDRADEGERRTDGLGSRISRFAGKRENGEPQHLVLMECTEEDYKAGIREKEQLLKPFDEAIRAGADTTGRLQDSYVPSTKSSISHTA